MSRVVRLVVLLFLVVAVGCGSPTELDPNFVEGWAAAIAGAALRNKPEESPDSDEREGKCETCDGTGKVGDGRVSTTCLDCGGDGVLGKQETEVAASVPRTTQAEVCVDGNCGPLVTKRSQWENQSTGSLPVRTGPVRRLMGRFRR